MNLWHLLKIRGCPKIIKLYNDEALMKNKKVIAFIVLIIVVVLWGLAPVASKAVFDNDAYSPGLLIALRGLCSIVAMAIFITNLKHFATAGFRDYKAHVAGDANVPGSILDKPDDLKAADEMVAWLLA